MLAIKLKNANKKSKDRFIYNFLHVINSGSQ